MIRKCIAVFLCLTLCLTSCLCIACAEDSADCLAIVQCFEAAEQLYPGLSLADFEAKLTEKGIVYLSKTAEDARTRYEFLPYLVLTVTGDPIETACLEATCATHQGACIKAPMVLLQEGSIDLYSAAMTVTDHAKTASTLPETTIADAVLTGIPLCDAWLIENGLEQCYNQHDDVDQAQRMLLDNLTFCAMLRPGLSQNDVLTLAKTLAEKTGARFFPVNDPKTNVSGTAAYRCNFKPAYNKLDTPLALIFEKDVLISCQLSAHLYDDEGMIIKYGVVLLQSDVDWNAAQ